ncbi:MAG: cytochrome c3 family protein [Desulfosalsimonas sp.]
MSRNSVFSMIWVFALVFLLCIAVVSAETSEKDAHDAVAEMITLEGGTLGKVQFPHQLHQKTLGDCSECHVLYPPEKRAIRAAQKAGDLKKQQVMNTQCIKCHVGRQSIAKPSGPTKCAKCHRR